VQAIGSIDYYCYNIWAIVHVNGLGQVAKYLLMFGYSLKPHGGVTEEQCAEYLTVFDEYMNTECIVCDEGENGCWLAPGCSPEQYCDHIHRARDSLLMRISRAEMYGCIETVRALQRWLGWIEDLEKEVGACV